MTAAPTVEAVRARCTFPPSGSTAVCAVSGGADSLALLVLAADAGLDVTAVHVDHGLRDGSAAEADVVEDVARRFGAAFRAERVVVEPGGDLEARARRARHDVLAPDALFGHTADDQAETVLLALLRGAGLDGLRAMTPDRHPILGLRRSETEAICAELGLDPVRDPSNDDPRFRRNRIRHELLPLLDDIAERDVTALLARTAEVLRPDVDLLGTLAEGIDPTDAVGLAAAPVALARRSVRAWLRAHDPEHHPPDAAAVERVLAVDAETRSRRRSPARSRSGGTDSDSGSGRSGRRRTRSPPPLRSHDTAAARFAPRG